MTLTVAPDHQYTVQNRGTLNITDLSRECPVCGVHSAGALTIFSNEPSVPRDIAGDYCLRCYMYWVNQHIPRLKDRA